MLYMIEMYQNKTLKERERTKRSRNQRSYRYERVAEAS